MHMDLKVEPACKFRINQTALAARLAVQACSNICLLFRHGGLLL